MALRDLVRAALLGPPTPLAPPPAPSLAGSIRHDAIALAAQAFEAAATRMDSIANSLSGLGGENDKGTAARPSARHALSMSELSILWQQNGYAKRYVALPASDATRKGAKIVDETTDAQPMSDEDRRLNVWAHVGEADTWARLYGGSILVPTLEEDIPAAYASRPAEWLRQPLDLTRIRRVKSLVVYDRWQATPFDFDRNVSSPRFREASMWSLPDGKIVHASRVIYFAGARLPPTLRETNGGFDDSVLEGPWDKLRNKESIDQGAALLAQELKLNVVSVDGLADAGTNDQAAAFSTRMRLLAAGKSLLNLIVLGKGETFQTLATPISGFKELDENAMGALCAVTGFPRTKLFGESPGGLQASGEGQAQLWAILVSAHQNDDLREPCTRLYTILYAQKQGPTQGVIPAKWRLEWLPLDEPSGKVLAETREVVARTDQTYIDAGVYTAEDVARSRFGKKGWQPDILPVHAPVEDPAARAEAIVAAVAPVEAVTAASPTAAIVAAMTRQDADTYTVPPGARGNAKRALRWREEHPDEIQGMEATGWARARQLGTDRTVSAQDIVEIAAWFARHGAQAATRTVAPEHRDTPWKDAGYVAWLGWGGDTMRAYVEQVRAGMDTRGDAADTLWIGVPLPAAARPMLDAARAAVEAITGALDPDTDPHVTVLHAGAVAPEALPEVSAVVEAVAVKAYPEALTMSGARTFPVAVGAPIPVVLTARQGWGLESLNAQLLRRLAHRVTAPQHATFEPHITLGWAPSLTDEQRARLAELVIPAFEWSAGRLELHYGGQVVRVAALEGRRDGADAGAAQAAK